MHNIKTAPADLPTFLDGFRYPQLAIKSINLLHDRYRP
jgi:hypothetical protein